MAEIYTPLATMYKHTQQSRLLFGFFVLVALAAAVPIYITGERNNQIFGIAVGIVVLAIAAVFSRLTIDVDHDAIRWAFAAGMFRKSVDLKDVASAAPTRTTLIDGVGIHWGPRGTVYNVSLGDAVIVTMRNKKTFLLGSDEPIELANAIQSRLGGTP